MRNTMRKCGFTYRETNINFWLCTLRIYCDEFSLPKNRYAYIITSRDVTTYYLTSHWLA